MTEQELRALVRDAIAKHAGAHASDPRPSQPMSARLHPSHAMIALPDGADNDDGVCIIEPSVACNHCGYCKSVGH
jgi:hypothetical protein